MKQTYKISGILFLIIIAVLFRLLRFIPNVEVVTLVTFLAAFYLGKKEALIIALSSMAISDVFIGNTNIALFTWSAFGVTAVGAIIINKLRHHVILVSPELEKVQFRAHPESITKKSLYADSGRTRFVKSELVCQNDGNNITPIIITTLFATAGGIISTLWFYLWTNFGVWFLDSCGMYPKTLNGLITCYINALPFLRNQLVGNLIIIPIGFLIVDLIMVIHLNISSHFKSIWSSVFLSQDLK